MKITGYLEREYGVDRGIKGNWQANVNEWKSWYQGKVKHFHNYTIYNGKSRIKKKKLSLQMAKKSCEDWADVLFNERVRLELGSDEATKKLFDILQKLNFWEFMNASVEQSGAVGTGAVVVSVTNIEIDENGVITNSDMEPRLDYVSIDNIYPISWENGIVTECAFATRKLIKGKFYVWLSIHHYNDYGMMVIENKLFKSDKFLNVEELDYVAAEEIGADIIPEYATGSDIPWFALIKPAGTNNIKPELPFGMPYFSQAIDVLKRIDNTFDALQNEVDLGRKRIFIRSELTDVDKVTGEDVTVFDPNDMSVYLLPKGFNSEDFLQTESSELRVDELTKDLDNSLALFGDKVGFGVQYYQLDPAGQVRELGIMTQNSKMIRRKKKHEIVLESAVYDIVRAVLYASNQPYDNLKITFDDDIIDDENERKKTSLTEISAGVLAKHEYREMFMGEDANKAIESIKAINEENMTSLEIEWGDVNNADNRGTRTD